MQSSLLSMRSSEYDPLAESMDANSEALASSVARSFARSFPCGMLMPNTPEEDIRINTAVKDETIWLTQKGMSELFGCSTDNISLHLKNIYSDGELNPESTAEDFSVTPSGCALRFNICAAANGK